MALFKRKPKKVGDNASARWLEKYCPCGCGCKLRTDGKWTWCSFVRCNYIREAIGDERRSK